jgi:thioredoxin 1
MAIHFSDADFESKVLQSNIPVLVDFYAEWCGPCKMMAPIIDKLAAEYEGKILIGKMEVDANEKWPMEFMIQSIPTLIAFKKGQPVARDMGFKSEEALKKLLDCCYNKYLSVFFLLNIDGRFSPPLQKIVD